MLTAPRAWVGAPHAHGKGAGCAHLLRRHLLAEESGAHEPHHQKSVVTRVGLGVAVAPLPQPPAVCQDGVERDAGLWVRYSRKRKKQERPSPEAEDEDGLGAGKEDTRAVQEDETSSEMCSPPRQVCSDCGTSRTPLWRKGPAGPKSLCNACGIRYRKIRSGGVSPPSAAATAPAAAVGSASRGDQTKGSPRASHNTPVPLKLKASAGAAAEARKEEEKLQRRQRRRQEVLWLLLEESRKFELPCGKEAVEAAVLLMAMSSGLFVHSY